MKVHELTCAGEFK